MGSKIKSAFWGRFHERLTIVVKAGFNRWIQKWLLFSDHFSLKLNDYFLIAKIIVNDYNFMVANEQP